MAPGAGWAKKEGGAEKKIACDCHNCGESGHRYFECTHPLSPALQKMVAKWEASPRALGRSRGGKNVLAVKESVEETDGDEVWNFMVAEANLEGDEFDEPRDYAYLVAEHAAEEVVFDPGGTRIYL